MRIGMLGPIAWRTPPRAYGPWELVVSNLTEGLVRRGHAVTLFATGDSVTSARLDWVAPRGYEEDPAVTPKVYEALHIARAMERARDFDILHNHFDFLPLAWSRLIPTPMVSTIHGFSSPAILPAYRAYDDRVAYVSISDADRDRSLTYAATVHNGIDPAEFTFQAHPGNGLVVLGRVHPDKGTHHAIEVARLTGRPLTIAGIIQDRDYFERLIKPRIDGHAVRFVGAVGPAARDVLLGGSAALLHLVDFAEPFGLAMTEAMACGTPVIGFGRGAVPEVVEDGRTGFIVDTIKEAAAAVAGLETIDRRACRARVERYFSVDMMVRRYEAVYDAVIARRAAPRQALAV